MSLNGLPVLKGEAAQMLWEGSRWMEACAFFVHPFSLNEVVSKSVAQSSTAQQTWVCPVISPAAKVSALWVDLKSNAGQ